MFLQLSASSATVHKEGNDRDHHKHFNRQKCYSVWGKSLNELNCHLHPLDSITFFLSDHTLMEHDTKDVFNVHFVDKREVDMKSPLMEAKGFKESLH